MYRRRICFILFAVALIIIPIGCKQETTSKAGDTYEVDMPGEPEHSYVEFPLDGWNTTLPMDTYEVMLGENELFTFTKVNWADMLSKVRQQYDDMGEVWNEDELYETVAATFFAYMVNSGKAAGSAEETLLNGRKAYLYAISSLDDSPSGESVVTGEGKGHFVVVPTERSLYIMVYYANNETYNAETEQGLFDSLKIYED